MVPRRFPGRDRGVNRVGVADERSDDVAENRPVLDETAKNRPCHHFVQCVGTKRVERDE